MVINNKRHVNFYKKIKTKTKIPNYKYEDDTIIQFKDFSFHTINKLEELKQIHSKKHNEIKEKLKNKLKEIKEVSEIELSNFLKEFGMSSSSKLNKKDFMDDKELNKIKKNLLENKLKLTSIGIEEENVKIIQILLINAKDVKALDLYVNMKNELLIKEKNYFTDKNKAKIFHERVLNEIRKKLEISKNIPETLIDIYKQIRRY